MTPVRPTEAEDGSPLPKVPAAVADDRRGPERPGARLRTGRASDEPRGHLVVLFILIVAGYLILDGFDLGVGILHLPVGPDGRRAAHMLASIGPVWDGNEVWLVLTGGVLFACFPLAYASLFSGFYLAFMLVLVCLILRAVAIEFRSKEPSTRWRRAGTSSSRSRRRAWRCCWASPSATSSRACPSTARGNMSVTFVDLLNPFALLFGARPSAMFAMHGSLYLLRRPRAAPRAHPDARAAYRVVRSRRSSCSWP